MSIAAAAYAASVVLFPLLTAAPSTPAPSDVPALAGAPAPEDRARQDGSQDVPPDPSGGASEEESASADEHEPPHEGPRTDARARLVHEGDDPDAFRPPIQWGETFEGANQVPTYGDKAPVVTQHPLRLSGRPLYREGELGPGLDLFGEDNLVFHHLLVYGDWRNAAGFSDNGGPSDVDEVGRFATRLNLDIDLGITATERIHAFIRPLDRDADFTRFDFAGDDEGEEELLLDGNLDALFFEGDLGAMFRGPGYPSVPIAVGKMPLLFQNGVWVEDAFTGVAVSIPAKNSPRYDIANYDLTFFVAADDVTTGAAAGVGDEGDEDEIFLIGATAFVEAHEGYWEAGYGYTDGRDTVSDIDYHNLTVAFSRRYGGWLSNSVRAIWNVGQSLDGAETADGVLFLAENSLITRRPSTLIPYVNGFLGIGTPQSLARDAGAGGVLKNTGINFEADAQTAFPSLDATGHDVVGAAIGLEYLFDLDKQLVVEIAGQTPHGDENKSADSELGVGTRFQLPLSNAWILRFDAMYGVREDGDEISGIRVEVRWKF